MFAHPDHLVLFAAGNLGELGGDMSINSPATSKNCLAVGASSSTAESFHENRQIIGILITEPGIFRLPL